MFMSGSNLYFIFNRIILMYILNQDLSYLDRKDASDCSFEDSNQMEEQTEFSASEKISLNGDTQKMARNVCFPFRVGDDKLKGR